ncbi:MAG: hypothetical protein ACM30E_04070 [Nitrososphaerales archaeon]
MELVDAPDRELAQQVATVIEQARKTSRAGLRVMVTVRGGCRACDPGSCPECGHLFTGETITIDHALLGKRAISDRTVHFLKHGITHYETGYVIHGEPVMVDIDVEDLAKYLDL